MMCDSTGIWIFTVSLGQGGKWGIEISISDDSRETTSPLLCGSLRSCLCRLTPEETKSIPFFFFFKVLQMQEKLQSYLWVNLRCEDIYLGNRGSQLKCYMGESQEPGEAFLDSESSNTFCNNDKVLLLQYPKHHCYWRKNTKACLATEAISATTTTQCFRNQIQLPNTERGLLVFRSYIYAFF